MSKNKSKLVCRECGYESVKWLGRCPSCGSFNTMDEEVVLPDSPGLKAGGRRQGEFPKARPLLDLAAEDPSDNERDRIATGLKELDRVFGGGLVRGSVTLLGGDPGIGKSTILLQASGQIAKQYKVLYVSGEESRRQIRLRADRLQISSNELLLLTNTEFQAVEQTI